MEIRSNVRILNYFKKMLSGDTKNILPFPIRVQKPVPMQMPCVPLPRCTPDSAAVPAAALNRFLCALSTGEGINAHTVYVLRHGKVVCEAAFAPYSGAYWHVSHSLCKSVTGTAVGMLIDEGKLSLNEFICDIFPEKCTLLTSKRMRAVTVKHLVTMRSGVNFRETGAVLEKDWVAAYLSAEVSFEPGGQFNYNSMNSYMLSAIITRRTGETMFEYLTPRLFRPLGFGSVAWETCPMGINKGGWGLYSMPEDMAKLGQLYLQRGVWTVEGEKRQLLSEAWIADATQPDSIHENGEEYGYQLWTHSADGSFAFNGMFGQYVVVSPELAMVTVVNAGSGNLFTNGPTWIAVQQLMNDVRQSDAAGFRKSRSADRTLAYTLTQLRYGVPVPKAGATVRGRMAARLKLLLAGTPARREAASLARCSALAGCAYRFEKCKFGLMPIVLSCMNDFYPQGLSRIAFAIEENRLTLLWTESGATQHIPIGFAAPAMGCVNFGGNLFVVGTTGCFTADEDGCPVLKLTVNFVESSSTQRIKLFFLPGQLRVALSEVPSLPYVIELVKGTSPEPAYKELALFRDRDMDYISFQFNKLCAPVHTGMQEQKSLPKEEAPASDIAKT
ncbi:MAG: serine hydrolase [Ruthenibacterium sp.]